MRHFFDICLLALLTCIGSLPVCHANAETQSGEVTFVLGYEEQDMETYRKEHPADGAGAYVYVQEITMDDPAENPTIYRYPLSEPNGYQGRFEIPYGNYKVIPCPNDEDGMMEVSFSDVFAISENTPRVEIGCSLSVKQSATSTEIAEPKPAETPDISSINEIKTETKEENSGFPLSMQNILTIIFMIIVIIIWTYNRFVKYRK